MTGLSQIHKSENMKAIPKDLPVYFIYGEEDPVGDYGKTVQKLYNIYLKNKMQNVTLKSYPEDRHEILNEVDKEAVEKDILDWLESVLKKWLLENVFLKNVTPWLSVQNKNNIQALCYIDMELMIRASL